jgi:tetratricopeptide (TPR) repeat protein
VIRFVRKLFTGVVKRPGQFLLVLGLLVLIGVSAFIVLNYFRGRSLAASARQATEKRDFARAYRDLRDYLEIHPKDPEMQFLAGRTARRARCYPEALAHLTRAEELGWASESVSLERILLRTQQGGLEDRGRILIRQADAGHPDAALILEALIQGDLAAGRLDEALAALERLLKLQPENGQGWLWYAEVHTHMARPEHALKASARALELLGDDDQARLQYARALLTLNRHSDALPYFERLAERRPDDPNVLVGLVACRRQLGQAALALQPAEALLARADRLPPHLRVQALLECGRVALGRGERAKAESHLRGALALDPNHQEALFALAGCLEHLDKKEEAAALRARHKRIEKINREMLEVVRRIGADPSNLELRCRAGELAFEAGHAAHARVWLHSVLRIDPAHAQALKLLQDQAQKTGKGPANPR